MIKDLFAIRKPNFKVILLGYFGLQSYRLFGSVINPLEIFGIIYFLYYLVFDLRKKVDSIFQNNIYISMRNLLLFWSGCQFISDIINQSTIIDSIKGILSPILILCTIRLLLVINKYFNNRYFVEDIFIGYSFNRLYKLLFLSESIEVSLKMGALIFIGFLFFSLLRNIMLRYIITLFLFVISLNFAIRSAAINFFLLFIINLIFKAKDENYFNLKIFPNIFNGILKYLLVLSFFLLSTPLFNYFNFLLIRINPSGDRVAELEKQIERKGGVFTARPEYLSFFTALKDSPLIGHGSWAIDKKDKYFLINERRKPENQRKSDRKILAENCEIAKISCENKIPTHSPIHQTVIWSGLLSTAFFFYLLNLQINIILKLNIDYPKKLLIINSIFNIFFTPLLGHNRGIFPIMCLVVILTIYESNKIRSNNYARIKNKN